MSKVEKFEDLECWKEARELVFMVYKLTNSGAVSKDFDYKSQMRRASISVMNNIAEGFGRYSHKEFIRFLEYSSSSASEVKSMCYLVVDLNYASQEEAEKLKEQTEKTRRMVLALLKYLKHKKR